MKNKYIALMLILLVLITLVIFFKKTYLGNINYSEINEYLNTKYILSDDDKKMISKRLKNDNFFNYYKEVIEQNTVIRIYKDDKDGNAWGTISLIFNKNFEEEIKRVLLQTGENISDDQRIYGIIDEYGSIYIEKSYLYEKCENIKLVFSVKLPYRYNLYEYYNENIRFFLKINELN